jgi:hypothetical protein
MEFDYTQEDLLSFIARTVRADQAEEDQVCIFTIPGHERTFKGAVSREKISNIIEWLNSSDIVDETGIYNETYFEIIILEEGGFTGRRVRDGFKIEGNGISYEVGPTSDEYLLWLIANACTQNSYRHIGLGMFFAPHRLDIIHRQLESNEYGHYDILDIIRRLSSRLVTLKIKTDIKSSIHFFQKAMHSFAFHVAFNLDLALVPQRYFEDIIRRGRIERMRRSRFEDLDPPRRHYNENLVNHYILAISADDASVQYLSYYHILENFFEKVFQEELIQNVTNKITDPSFSYKRSRDIEVLINLIKVNIQIRSETVSFNEKNALQLTLKKFVNLRDLQNKIDEYDGTLQSFYQLNDVPFSHGNSIPFTDSDETKIIREMSERIYKTRNALVHSKEGEKARYTPFKDERALMREIPLMRFVAEMVILGTSNAA